MELKSNKLKKSCTDGDFIEYGVFPDPEVQHDQDRPSTSTSTPADANNLALVPSSAPMLPAKRKTVRGQAEERRAYKKEIADTALTLAEQSVPKAMMYVRRAIPSEFMHSSDKLV